MDTGRVEDRDKVVQELFSGLYSVNRKAKMVLELLGFRSAAALPEHLHAAVLQMLLMGPIVGPFCRRTLSPRSLPEEAAQSIPLRSEGCVIQCLFADWLTKTSKWLKVPRYRYVMLLSVEPTPDAEKGRHGLAIMNNTASKPAASVAEEIPHIRGEQTEFAGLKQEKMQKAFPQLLLVTFKAPQEPFASSDHGFVDSDVLKKAEPSEVFSIDSTHRALCQRVPCGKETQLVLVVEGLGGRLLILGELSGSAASPSGITRIHSSNASPLEQLAHLINEAAPFCAAPRPSRWRRLLQVFAATATAVDLGESTAIPEFGGSGVGKHGKVDRAVLRESQSATGCWQKNCTASEEACSPVVREEQQTISLVALFLRFSIAACLAICRPLTLVMRHCYFRPTMPRRPCVGRSTAATSNMPGGGCSNYRLEQNSLSSIHCTRESHSCGCKRRPQCARISSGQCTSSTCVARPQRTLRQLIDDQQRSLAAVAVREYRRKVALAQHEFQMSRQQASRALMDEHGQLFPQVHLLSSHASYLDK